MSQLFKCSLCKEGIDGLALLVKTSCGHIFHLSCMGELWISCPECDSAISRTELELAQKMLKPDEEVKLNNSCDQEKRLINCEKAVERITSKIQNRLNECEKNIKALIKVKSHQKISDLEKRLQICEANTFTQQKEQVQYEFSIEYSNKVQNLLNEFEKKVQSINQYNAQQMEEKVQLELSNKNWNKMQNRLNEWEKKVDALKKSNSQLKINVKQANDLRKSQDGCGKNAEMLKKVIAQLEIGTNEMSRLQNRLNECEKKVEYLKKVNAQLELGAKQTQALQKRLDKKAKDVENTIELKTQLKNVNQNTVELQDRVQSMEKIIMELQQKAHQKVELKTVTMDPTANELPEVTSPKENPNETKKMLHELEMAQAQDSFINTQEFECAIRNEITEKNQKIKDLEQQLGARALLLEQEKENSKSLSNKQNNMQEILVASLMPDKARDLVKKHHYISLSNDSDASVNISEQKEILPVDPTIGKEQGDDDNEKVTFAATTDDNCAELKIPHAEY